MHPIVREEIMKSQVADRHRDAAQASLARAARRSHAQAPARQAGITTPTRSLLFGLLTAVSARTTRGMSILNLHQLADEPNHDRLADAETQRPARQLQSQRRNDTANQALQSIRQAINEIDAIIESALNGLTESARATEDADSRLAETDDTENNSAVPASETSLR